MLKRIPHSYHLINSVLQIKNISKSVALYETVESKAMTLLFYINFHYSEVIQ